MKSPIAFVYKVEEWGKNVYYDYKNLRVSKMK
jgi:hypothetical protein